MFVKDLSDAGHESVALYRRMEFQAVVALS